jgi:hypothetical protein
MIYFFIIYSFIHLFIIHSFYSSVFYFYFKFHILLLNSYFLLFTSCSIFYFISITGASQIITVKFRPDRSRIHPYYEEIQILKSSKSTTLDDVLRIGMIGKVQEHQIFVHTLASTEKIIADNMNSNNIQNVNLKSLDKMGENSSISISKDTNSTNNPFNSILNNGMKKLVENSMIYSHTKLPGNPSILLEFPNPYDKNTDPASYTEIDAKTRKMTTSKINPSSSSVKSVDSLKSGGQTLGCGIGGEVGRVQFKRILIESLLALDKRIGSTAAGSFEVILSAAAKDSGIWSTGSVLLNANGKINNS